MKLTCSIDEIDRLRPEMDILFGDTGKCEIIVLVMQRKNT